jgi:two-component system CheB/CheR fusion protein
MIVAFVLIVSIAMFALDRYFHIGNLGIFKQAGIAIIAALMPGVITFYMAGRLTGLIHELRRSTEAVAAGNFDEVVDVNCACEIGGLADSFRSMVARLNSNILRMNVLAYTDPVTRLPNRAVLNHVLSRSLHRMGNEPFTGAVVFIDLDKFKQVNDTLGHDAGDELLRQASLRILAKGFDRTPETIDTCMTLFGELCDRPPSDIVFCRFAGDEFVAFLPGIHDRHVLASHAERIIAALDEPFWLRNTKVMIGASVGISCTPHDTTDPAELLNFADLAMYAAKQAGRRGFAFFDGTLREQALQRINIERELREGLQRNELTIYFQPKIDGRDLVVRAAEALVRWKHPVRGILSPGEFITVAEQSGLIEQLGEQVLRLAMAQSAAWAREGHPLNISVNVSHLQFTRPNFVSDVLDMLGASGALPHTIELELTESTAMQDTDRTIANCEALRTAGLRIAIDDFGCGFSNLSNLAHLPFDTLKIDRSLVECIGTDTKGESVVKAVISMGHSLGHEIVAEGVESLRQYSFLQQHNCDIIQGYLFARPMSAEAFAVWRRQRVENPVANQINAIKSTLQAGT